MLVRWAVSMILLDYRIKKLAESSVGIMRSCVHSNSRILVCNTWENACLKWYPRFASFVFIFIPNLLSKMFAQKRFCVWLKEGRKIFKLFSRLMFFKSTWLFRFFNLLTRRLLRSLIESLSGWWCWFTLWSWLWNGRVLLTTSTHSSSTSTTTSCLMRHCTTHLSSSSLFCYCNRSFCLLFFDCSSSLKSCKIFVFINGRWNCSSFFTKSSSMRPTSR